MTRRQVTLRPEADFALLVIWEYTKKHFGALQARKYLAGFHKAFEQLATFPQSGTAAVLGSRIHKLSCQKHWILYRHTADGIEIGTIIDQRQDFLSELETYERQTRRKRIRKPDFE